MSLPNYKPRLGEVVIYRTDGRNGMSYDLPAIITCVRGTHPGDYPDGSKNPLPVPEDDFSVHLTVFTPGGFGTKIHVDEDPEDEDFVGATTMKPGSGSYVEWNVPQHADYQKNIENRSWRRH